jgi:hypothetical protein
MSNLHLSLNLAQPADILLDQLSYAEDILECPQPEVNLGSLLGQLLMIALLYQVQAVRIEALGVLGKGLVNHPREKLDLAQLGQKLSALSGAELLDAIHVIGLTCDTSLAEYVRPFLRDSDSRIRAEAAFCLVELRAVVE